MSASGTDIYWQRKLAGLCVRCAEPVTTGKSRCAPCLALHRNKRNPLARRNALCRCEGSIRVVPLDGKPPLGATEARAFIKRHRLPRSTAARVLGCNPAHLEALLARGGRLPRLDFEVMHMAMRRYEERLRDAG